MTLADWALAAATINMLIVMLFPAWMNRRAKVRKKRATQPPRKIRLPLATILPVFSIIVSIRSLIQNLSHDELASKREAFSIAWNVASILFVVIFLFVFLPLSRRVDKVEADRR